MSKICVENSTQILFKRFLIYINQVCDRFGLMSMRMNLSLKLITPFNERNKMERKLDKVNKTFKYETLMKDLWKQHEKFEEIINDKKRGFTSLSDDDCKVHNLFHLLLGELKSQKTELYLKCS